MKYNCADKAQKRAAMSYFMTLVGRRQLVEVKKLTGQRTGRQNRYLHVLINAFGANFGMNAEQAKTYYKRDLNADLYVFTQDVFGRPQKFLHSSADLSIEDMALSITRLKQFSADQGYPLPDADDSEWLMQLENELERQKQFM